MSFSMPCGSNSKIVLKGSAILNILCLKFNPLFKCDFHVINVIFMLWLVRVASICLATSLPTGV